MGKKILYLYKLMDKLTPKSPRSLESTTDIKKRVFNSFSPKVKWFKNSLKVTICITTDKFLSVLSEVVNVIVLKGKTWIKKCNTFSVCTIKIKVKKSVTMKASKRVVGDGVKKCTGKIQWEKLEEKLRGVRLN